MTTTPKTEQKVLCKSPSATKGTRIEKWKYEAVKKAILQVVPKGGEGILFKDLATLVETGLPERIKASLGSVSWYTTTVKLDLEARGEIKRVPDSKPQRLVK
ncbi:MAG: hypothetical protein HQM12_19175 [SAR324 cluster bacterium]|nr:hypothetical protein [SAR324 cluster bacterium]MBF0352256.1 hypothetical protein [SAR324 cluster bacterium]